MQDIVQKMEIIDQKMQTIDQKHVRTDQHAMTQRTIKQGEISIMLRGSVSRPHRVFVQLSKLMEKWIVISILWKN